MPNLAAADIATSYERDGFYFPVQVLSDEEVGYYRNCLEAAEAEHGDDIKRFLRSKPHLVFTWANALIHHPKILDAVEAALGPNILCWATSFFNKEPHDPAFVSWHQDSTYWGLEPHDVLTAWIAFSDVPAASGAMTFVPGSHKLEQMPHHDTYHDDNLLSRGQVVDMEIDDSAVVDVPLRAGEMSLHHIRLAHGSAPNLTDDRRLGFAIRYMAAHVQQVNGQDSATLVRGEDPYGNFVPLPAPKADLDEAALATYKAAVEKQWDILYSGAESIRPKI